MPHAISNDPQQSKKEPRSHHSGVNYLYVSPASCGALKKTPEPNQQPRQRLADDVVYSTSRGEPDSSTNAATSNPLVLGIMRATCADGRCHPYLLSIL